MDTVYLETSIVSHATARPSSDPATACCRIKLDAGWRVGQDGLRAGRFSTRGRYGRLGLDGHLRSEQGVRWVSLAPNQRRKPGHRKLSAPVAQLDRASVFGTEG